jgi:all-trans-8'-apo-beta-carotenal 15,15'-oxygenase
MPAKTVLEHAARAVHEETDATLSVVKGALPDSLRGVLYRNGPGTHESFGVPYDHPFDGDGMVTRFEFDGRNVRYRNRFVETRERKLERAARRPLFRSFGTNLPGGFRANALRMRFKNAANTSVAVHAGKLLALWEGGLPHELDGETLETKGAYDYEGHLKNRGPFFDRLLAPELPFSAHPKIDPETNELFNFGMLLGPRPRLLVYRASPEGRLDTPRVIALPRLFFVHDFALTARYCVFFLVPVAFRVAEALAGVRPPAEAIEGLQGAPTRVLMVPRDGAFSEAPVWLETSPCFIFHHAGAFEDAEGRVHSVVLRMPSFPNSEAMRAVFHGGDVSFPSAMATRYVFDPKARTVTEERLSPRPMELPTIDGHRVSRAYRHLFAIAGEREGDAVLRKIVRLDIETKEELLRDFGDDIPGEPVFVRARDGQGEGYLLVLVYRAGLHRSDLFVLRADTLETTCQLALPHHVPLGFHGTWVSGAWP